KQRHQVVRSFPNRYLFSLTNKLTFLFPISCILEIIFVCKKWEMRKECTIFQCLHDKTFKRFCHVSNFNYICSSKIIH
ncbi:MAG: hypothetical protein D8B56_08710, partial [Alloprevotella sp.]